MKMNQFSGAFFGKACLALAASLMLACGETDKKAGKEAQEVPADVSSGPQFANATVSNAWKYYMHLRKSLVETSATDASVAANALQEALGDSQPELRALAAAMAKEQDVEAQRALFSEFIAKSEPYFAGALSSGTLYKQYCPMAFGNKGGYWLSDVAEIRNPYFGDKMLTCGTVAETIVN